ncbi:hypothetical protein OHT68_46375 [Streptomyces canus]|uniref:glyceraldehyde 3-phosphate dehydrogenase NAD-binding domain-containing protein n=1 Tax=Streptomyces canus TaxID=58343 RepID=UPI002E28BDF4|nr:glyceraldehyde 3-phosphate dehydrogenase NAD-binding domain-containing protein [Streptomyces canus]
MPPPCGSRWPTCAPATRRGSANTAPTCPRSPTGPGTPERPASERKPLPWPCASASTPSGRIGPTCLRAALDRTEAGIQDAHTVAINDIASPATLAHLLGYDSTFGRIGRDVAHTVVIFGHGPSSSKTDPPGRGDRCRRSPVSSSAPGTTSAKHGADRPPRCPDSPWAPSPNRWMLEVPRGWEETPDVGHRAQTVPRSTPCSRKEVISDEQVLYGVADDWPRKL